jgi:hypothetical protein
MTMRRSQFGFPLQVQPRSAVSTFIVEPTLGFALNQPETDLQPGQTPDASNFLMREGALQLRPTLSAYTANENPVGPVTGGFTVQSSVGSFYPLVSGATQLAYYSNGSWSDPLSYVTTTTENAPPSGDSLDFTDIIQIYSPDADDMMALVAYQSYQTLYAWQSGQTTFSSVTSAPRARYLAAFDNFVLALNVRDTGSAESRYVQRVQWSDRGDPLQWDATVANSLAGSEDLLDARGEGTRIMVADNRVIVFFEDEIWQGVRSTGATSFQFSALDRTIGSPYPWTVTQTPLGIFFLGRDLMVYLLGKGSASAAPVGYPVQRRLRERINSPERAWGVWEAETGTYQLWYPVRGGQATAQEALYLNVGDNSFAPQSVRHEGGDLALSRGFVAFNESLENASTWSDLQAEGVTWSSIVSTWAQLGGASTFAGRVLATATSDGTIAFFSDGTRDLGLSIGARWRSHALGADTFDYTKVLQEVKLDYQSNSAATVSVRASRDQGATYDPAVTIMLEQSAQQNSATAHVYTHAEYPTFEVQVDSQGPKIYRLWATMRIGGR